MKDERRQRCATEVSAMLDAKGLVECAAVLVNRAILRTEKEVREARERKEKNNEKEKVQSR